MICGLEGIGKTSLSLSLIREGAGTFYSDNLVLYSARKVYPCFELIRLYSHDEQIVQKNFIKANAFRTQKDFYAPRRGITQDGTPVNLMIFPVFSKTYFVKKLTREEAVQTALVLSHLPAELSTYVEYRHLYNIVCPSFDPWRSQRETLTALLSHARCVIVGMPKSAGLEKNIERVKELIKSET